MAILEKAKGVTSQYVFYIQQWSTVVDYRIQKNTKNVLAMPVF